MDFHKGIKILRRRKWTFLGVALVAFCLVALAPENDVKPVPFYKSTAKILLTPSSTSGIGYSNGGAAANYGDLSRSWFADPTILNELIKSEELLTRVQTNSGLDLTWDALRAMISIEPVTNNGRITVGSLKLFELSVTTNDPARSEKLTRLITEEFVNYVQDLSAREFANTRRFIEDMVLDAEQRRLAAEEELMGLKAKYLESPSEESLRAEERALENERQAINREIVTMKAKVSGVRDYLDGRVSSPPWDILKDREGSLAQLEANVAEHKLELARKREIYTEENDNVVLEKSRLAKAEQLYQEALDSYVASLYQSTSNELRQKIAQRQSLNRDLAALISQKMSSDDKRQVKKLERQMTLWDENHLSLTQQLYQARVVEQSSRRQGAVNILERPRRGTPVYNASDSRGRVATTSKRKKVALAFPICLLIGAAAAFLREFLSASMRLRPRVEEALELPVIAVIPATPSELTVDWERYKRPMPERLNELVMAHSQAPPPPPNGRGNGGANGNGRSH